MAKPKTPKGSALKSALSPNVFEKKILETKGNEKQPIKASDK
ncbi:MAG: hypothetical protein ACREGC_01845 [Minisyncoccia bacterium]